MSEENKTQIENTQVIYDIAKDNEQLKKEFENKSKDFFTFEAGLTYKVKLTSTEVKPTIIKFNNEAGEEKEQTKYEIAITSKCSDTTTFEGTCLVPRSVFKGLVNSYEDGAVYNIARTGAGQDTRYSVSKDF